MKFSTYLSLMTMGATAAVAVPLFRDNVVAERREIVPAPIRRQEEAAATPSEDSALAAPTDAPVENSEAPFAYSTIANTEGFEFNGRSYDLSSSVEASTTTETSFPQETGNVHRNSNDFNNDFNNFNDINNGFNFNNGFNNFDVNNAAVITIREIQTITQFVAVEVPVFLGVQVNNNFREQQFVNQFGNLFQDRFNNWDVNVIDQLGLILSQQYEFLVRAGNNGFSNFDNNGFNSFVNKFANQFNVFQTFDINAVQQLLGVLQGFNVQDLGSFFGRSDLLFSQDIFNQFGINNDFNLFVQQLPQLILAIQGGAFNNDGIFNNLQNLDLNALNFLQII